MFIESEKMKAEGVNHSFRFSHRKRETYCTMAGECRAGSRETFFLIVEDCGYLKAEEDGCSQKRGRLVMKML